MSDRMRELVAEGVASGALDPGALDRYDAAVSEAKRMCDEIMDRSRPRGLELLARMCVHQWPLQPCEVP